MARLQTVDKVCTIFETDFAEHARVVPALMDTCSKNDDESDQDQREGSRILLDNLTQACQLLRDTSPKDPGFQDIVERINRTINRGIGLLRDSHPSRPYRNPYPLTSFTHSSEFPLWEEPQAAVLDDSGSVPDDSVPGFFDRCKSRPHDPWLTTPRPDNLSTTLARFNWDFPSPSAPSPLVNAVLQARCEISSDPLPFFPTAIANSDSCVLVSCLGGWRFRDPAFTYYLLDDSRDPDFAQSAITIRLNERESRYPEEYHDVGVDEANRLLFVADRLRIQSWAWGDPQCGAIYERAFPDCTLSTANHHGPISVFAPGRLLRAGTGSIAFWNLDDISSYPDDEMDWAEENSEATRDSDTIMVDGGEDPTTIIALADPQFKPEHWHIHPNLSGNMLCAPFLNGLPDLVSRDYSCVSIDLDSGKVSARYLGHSNIVRQFSTSPGDPNTFLTAAADGHVRLFDTRTPLPGITIFTDANAALLVYPDGVPLVFTGAGVGQAIKLWDLRAAKMVYELSTGNNDVNGLAWDAGRHVLYASTICENLDKNGKPTGYHMAQINGEDVSPEWLDDDDTGFDEMLHLVGWPSDSTHSEDYFGHLFDTAGHRIIRYSFNEQADPTILPISGEVDSDHIY